MQRLVIIGNSAAGLAAIEAIRSRDQRSRVTLIAAELHPPYSRVMLTYLLAGKVSVDELSLRGPTWYGRMGVESLLGQRAVGIDTQRGQVVVEHNRERRSTYTRRKTRRVAFDRLLIATGALAQRPALPGIDLPGVFCLRDVDDAVAILRYAEERGLFVSTAGEAPAVRQRKRLGRRTARARAVFLGGGPVCLQALTALASRGMRVTLVVRSPTILSQLADPYTARLAEKVLRQNGVRVLKDADPTRIDARSLARATPLVVHLLNGRRLPTDLVIIGKGTQPDIALARGTNIVTDVGILVDDTMATSVDGVFAAGDVAQAMHCVTGRKVCYGTWTNATEQGRIAGLNMIGCHTEWTGGLNRNVTTLFGNTLGSVGVFQPNGAQPRTGSGDGDARLQHYLDRRRSMSRRLVFRDGRCDGAVVWNACDDLGVLSWLISTRRDCSGWEDRLTRGETTLADAFRKGLASVPTV